MYAPVPHLSEHRFEIAHSLYFNVDDTDTKRRRNPVCGLKGWHNVGVLNMAKGGDAPTVSPVMFPTGRRRETGHKSISYGIAAARRDDGLGWPHSLT